MDIILTKKRGRLNSRVSKGLTILLCVLMTSAVFSPVLEHEFINYDDNLYVYDNPHIEGGLTWTSVKWALSADLLYDSPHADFWIPLTFLSHLLTVELFGMDPSGHHLVNLLFHVLNTVLLFWVLQRMTGALWASGFVAGLFGVHPLHVESVAWVTERKDVLSTLFWFLTLWAYLRYVERPTGFRYVWVVAGLVLGLLAKPMLMTLPFVLLLLDYWPLRRVGLGEWGRVWGLIREKVPLFVVAGLSIMVTYVALEGGGHVRSIEGLSLWTRIENAMVSTVGYMGKMLWPSGLAVLYPHPGDGIPVWKVWGAVLLLGGITVRVVWGMRRWPYLAVGWFWYVGTLVPTLGLVQAGLQSMADRYTYVPLIGLFIMVGWGMEDLSRSWPYRRVLLGGAAGLVLSALTVCTGYQVQHWRDSISLFEHAIKVTDQSYIAHLHLGSAYQDKGRFGDAMKHYRRAIAMNPKYIPPYMNLGFLHEMKGDLDEAERIYRWVLKGDPSSFKARFNLGNVYMQKGELALAQKELEETLRLNPDHSQAHNNLGFIFYSRQDINGASKAFSEAVRSDPSNAEAHQNLGIVFKQLGKIKIAEEELLLALKIKQDLTGAHRALGFLYLDHLGKPEKALHHFREAKQLLQNPDPELEEAISKISKKGA